MSVSYEAEAALIVYSVVALMRGVFVGCEYGRPFGAAAAHGLFWPLAWFRWCALVGPPAIKDFIAEMNALLRGKVDP